MSDGRSLARWAVLGAAGVLLPLLARGNDPHSKEGRKEEVKQTWRVGQVFIIGNETVMQSDILNQVPLYPGAVANVDDVRRAERNLARLPFFERPPRVRIGVDESSLGDGFSDVVIEVQENATTRLLRPAWDVREFLCRWMCLGPSTALREALERGGFPTIPWGPAD